jgi:hypothetical protein
MAKIHTKEPRSSWHDKLPAGPRSGIRCAVGSGCLALILLLAGCASAPPAGWTAVASGVSFREYAPQANSLVQVLRVDLNLVVLRLSPHAERGRALDGMSPATAAVNASFFDREFRPRGLTVSSGQPWPELIRGKEPDPLLACDAARHCEIRLTPPGAPDPQWQLAVSGTPWLIRDGQPRSAQDDATCAALCAKAHPRTAVGLDASGRTLFIVLAAGRRDPVLGLTLAELAAVMRELGAVQAFNLDGGGSSTLLIRGESRLPRPFNEPALRRVANALLIEPLP